MSGFEFRDAVRRDTNFLIFLSGGTGSGKTESAMRLATGLAGGKKFAVIDTENGRALHKADDYDFAHAVFDPPFSPERYAEAIKAADAAGFPVIVIDSGSHEYESEGGVLELQAAEFERLGRRESAKVSSWIEPKRRHKIYVRAMWRAKAHVIVCHRSEDKIEITKDENDRTVIRAKESLAGFDGWIPICERRLPFEAILSLGFTADAPGVPKVIKIDERRHGHLVPLDRPLNEDVGRALAEWAAGGVRTKLPDLVSHLRELLEQLGSDPAVIETTSDGEPDRIKFEGWVRRQIAGAEQKLAERSSGEPATTGAATGGEQRQDGGATPPEPRDVVPPAQPSEPEPGAAVGAADDAADPDGKPVGADASAQPDPPQPDSLVAMPLDEARAMVVPDRTKRGREDLKYAGQRLGEVTDMAWLTWALELDEDRWEPGFRQALQVHVDALPVAA